MKVFTKIKTKFLFLILLSGCFLPYFSHGYQIDWGTGGQCVAGSFSCADSAVASLYDSLSGAAGCTQNWPSYQNQTDSRCSVINTLYSMDSSLASIRAGLFACIAEKRLKNEINDGKLLDMLTKLKGVGSTKIANGVSILLGYTATSTDIKNGSEFTLSFAKLLNSYEYVNMINDVNFDINAISKFIKYISDTYLLTDFQATGGSGSSNITEKLSIFPYLDQFKIASGSSMLFEQNYVDQASQFYLYYYNFVGTGYWNNLNSTGFSADSMFKFIRYISSNYLSTSLSLPNPYDPSSSLKKQLDILVPVNAAKIATGIKNNWGTFSSLLPALNFGASTFTKSNTDNWVYRFLINLDDDVLYKVFNNYPEQKDNIYRLLGRVCMGGRALDGTSVSSFSGDVLGRYPCTVPVEYYGFTATNLTYINYVRDMMLRDDVYLYTYKNGSNYKSIIGPVNNYMWHYRTGLLRGLNFVKAASFVDNLVSRNMIDKKIIVAAFGYLDWNYKPGNLLTGDENLVTEIPQLCQNLSGDTIATLYHTFEDVNGNGAYGNFSDMLVRRQICINTSGKSDYIMDKLVGTGDISSMADYYELQSDSTIKSAACNGSSSVTTLKLLLEYYVDNGKTSMASRFMNIMGQNCLYTGSMVANSMITLKAAKTFENSTITLANAGSILNNIGPLTIANGSNIIMTLSGLNYNRLYSIIMDNSLSNDKISSYLADNGFNSGLDVKLTKDIIDSNVSKIQDIVKLQSTKNLSKTVAKIKQIAALDGYNTLIIEERPDLLNSGTGYVQKLFSYSGNYLSIVEGANIIYNLTGNWNSGGIVTGDLVRNIVNSIDDIYLAKIFSKISSNTGDAILSAVGRYCIGGNIIEGSSSSNYTGDAAGRYPCTVPVEYYSYTGTDLNSVNKMTGMFLRNDVYLYTYKQPSDFTKLIGPVNNYNWHSKTTILRGLSSINAANLIDNINKNSSIDKKIIVGAFGYLDWNYKTGSLVSGDQSNAKEISQLCQNLSGDTIASLYHTFEDVNGNGAYGNFSDMLVRRQICINTSGKSDYIMNKLVGTGDISSVASYMETQDDSSVSYSMCKGNYSVSNLKTLLEYYVDNGKTSIASRFMNIMGQNCLYTGSMVANSMITLKAAKIFENSSLTLANAGSILNNTGVISIANGGSIIMTLSGLNYNRLYSIIMDNSISSDRISAYFADNTFDQGLDIKLTTDMETSNLSKAQDITRLQSAKNLSKTIAKIKQMGINDGLGATIVEENSSIVNLGTGNLQKLFSYSGTSMAVTEGANIIYNLSGNWNSGGIVTGDLVRNIINSIDDRYLIKINTVLGGTSGSLIMGAVGRYCVGGNTADGSSSTTYTGDSMGRYPCTVPSEYYSLLSGSSTYIPFVYNMYYRNDIYLYTYLQNSSFNQIVGSVSNYQSLYKVSLIRGLGNNALRFLNNAGGTLKNDFCTMISSRKGTNVDNSNGIWVTNSEFSKRCPSFVSYFDGDGSLGNPYRKYGDSLSATTVSAVSCQSYNTGATSLNNGSVRSSGSCGNGSLACLSDGYYLIDPDGVGGNNAFNTYCDMNINGGGWTLISKATSTNNDVQPGDTNKGSLPASAGVYSKGVIKSLGNTSSSYIFKYTNSSVNYILKWSNPVISAVDSGWIPTNGTIQCLSHGGSDKLFTSSPQYMRILWDRSGGIAGITLSTSASFQSSGPMDQVGNCIMSADTNYTGELFIR